MVGFAMAENRSHKLAIAGPARFRAEAADSVNFCESTKTSWTSDGEFVRTILGQSETNHIQKSAIVAALCIL